jgi:hypothetical protein
MSLLNQQLRSSEVNALLRCGSVFRGSLLAVTLIEAIHATSGVYQLLLARKERVTSRADFNVQVTFPG